MSEVEILTGSSATDTTPGSETTDQPPLPQPPQAELSAAELRWRNYQRLIWTQQQIHRQIQQQSNNTKQANGDPNVVNEDGVSNSVSLQRQVLETLQRSPEIKLKEGSETFENLDTQAPFLGPILWDKRLPHDGSDFKLEYVDLEEFLTENGIPFDPSMEATFAVWKPVDQSDTSGSSSSVTTTSPTPMFVPSQFMSGSSLGQDQIHVSRSRENHMTSHEVPESRSPSPCSSSSQCMSQDGTPAVSPDSTQLTELHPASVPGHEFDPRIRAFTDDELKPQPMIKKSKKQFIPDEQKDTRYWARRRKNNLAAKRSRDARRVKENQIAMRACFLEKENHVLKQELERIQAENSILKEQLNHFH